MDNVIYIPVNFEEERFEFKGIVQRFGYFYRISVDVQDQIIQFEQDEEGNYRALLKESPIASQIPPITNSLIEAIAKVLTSMT
ncbi:hypothetical protein [Mucilaginibacter agri]|uniref:Uncharacterized protein n=1 Tax=Mucilaginibacter agri TaxID=2695265 RepID=A0A966DSQ2_9SPHI|nr:hypothetical protein [Mucilaginibacter agri]NCD68004.1 hypothetical protein [Mucilaginibacter agri]